MSRDTPLKLKKPTPPEPGSTCIECGSSDIMISAPKGDEEAARDWCRCCNACYAMWGVTPIVDAPGWSADFITFHHTSAAVKALMWGPDHER